MQLSHYTVCESICTSDVYMYTQARHIIPFHFLFIKVSSRSRDAVSGICSPLPLRPHLSTSSRPPRRLSTAARFDNVAHFSFSSSFLNVISDTGSSGRRIDRGAGGALLCHRREMLMRFEYYVTGTRSLDEVYISWKFFSN